MHGCAPTARIAQDSRDSRINIGQNQHLCSAPMRTRVQDRRIGTSTATDTSARPRARWTPPLATKTRMASRRHLGESSGSTSQSQNLSGRHRAGRQDPIETQSSDDSPLNLELALAKAHFQPRRFQSNPPECAQWYSRAARDFGLHSIKPASARAYLPWLNPPRDHSSTGRPIADGHRLTIAPRIEPESPFTISRSRP